MITRISVTGIESVAEQPPSERIETDVGIGPTVSVQEDNKNNNISRGNVKAMQDYKDEADKVRYDQYADLYGELLAVGKTPAEALQICRHLQKTEECYFKVIEDEAVQIGLRFPVAWLEKHFGFSKLEMNDKTELLWELGMDVKGGKKWHTRTERARDYDGESNDAVLQQIVWGAERLDEDYLQSRDSLGRRVASSEAQDWRRSRNGGVLRP